MSAPTDQTGPARLDAFAAARERASARAEPGGAATPVRSARPSRAEPIDLAGRGTTVSGLLSRPLRAFLPQLVGLSFFINVLSFAIPIFVIQVYDRVVPHAGVETLKALAIAVVLAIAFDFVLKQARARVVQMAALRVDVALSRALATRLIGAPLPALEARSEAAWRAALRDGETVRDSVAGPLVTLVVDLPFILLAIAVVAMVATPVAWVLAALAPLYLLVAFLSARAVAAASREEHDVAQAKYALTGDIVAGRAVGKALGMGPGLQRRWETIQADLIERALHRGARVDGFGHASATLGLLTTVGMTTVGAMAIIGQDMTIGGLIAANMLAARVVQPLTQLVGLWRGVERYRDAASRLDPILALPVEAERGAVARPKPKGALAIESGVFAYPEADAAALDGVTARFEPGKIYGVCGANGSGKTTLLKALLGLYPLDEGRVLLDGADLGQFGRGEIARWIGYAPQEPFLFDGSIRDAIARGRDDVSDEAILSAAAAAGVDGVVAEMADGYGASVGERGKRLSPGCRQRVALARALVDDPCALLLDEPSANLDFDAERALCETLQRLKPGRAIIVVSHARSLLEICDEVLILHKGRIAMAGPASEVMPTQRASGPNAPARRPGPVRAVAEPTRLVGDQAAPAAADAAIRRRSAP